MRNVIEFGLLRLVELPTPLACCDEVAEKSKGAMAEVVMSE